MTYFLNVIKKFPFDSGDETPTIDAETWKVIAQENLDGEDYEINNKVNTMRSSILSDVGSSRVSSCSSDASMVCGDSRNNMDNNMWDVINNRSASRESNVPILPEINRSGSLVAQDLQNNLRNSRPSSINSTRSSVINVKNSLTLTDVSSNFEDGTELLSMNGDTPVPTPPVSEKRNNSGSNRSRGTTPVNKSLS